MLSLFDNKCYKTSENPQKLVVFVHGYNGSPEAIDYAVQGLRKKLSDAFIVVPRAPFVCEKDEDNLQWLSFYKEDPDVRFRNPEATIAEIYDIFDRLGADFAKVAKEMNDFIDEQQALWNIDDKNTYLVGFSQGAMISIYTALTRNKALGGCVPIAGLIPGYRNLKKEIISRPPFLVLHGREDATVQYKTLPTTLEWLKEQKVNFKLYEFDGLAHKMSDDEMEKVAEFINS